MIKRAVRFVALAMVLVVTWGIMHQLQIVDVIAPPNARFATRLRIAFNYHPFHVASPHHTYFQEMKLSLIPEAYACGTGGYCDSTTLKDQCNPNCPGMCGNCPNCNNGPCTIKTCSATTTLSYTCSIANNGPPCTACELDQLKSGCTRCAPPNDCP